MKLTHTLAATLCATTVLVAGFGAHAQTPPAPPSAQAPQAPPAAATDHAAHHPAAAAPQSDGEVRKVDKPQGKLTLRHGPLQNLDMPAMTMVFRAADPKLLEGLKDGDKVKFSADRVNGAFVVTAIQVVK